MRFPPIAMFLVLVSVLQVAGAESPGGVNQLEASVRAIIHEHCVSCNEGTLSTAKPAALKIFDLREGDWTARMSDDQLTTVVGRVKGKNLPTRQQAQVAQLMEQKREERATRAVPPSGPALSQLEYFVGEWQCHGKHLRTEFSAGSSGSGAVEIKPALQGAWYSVRVQTPKGYEGAGFWGREAAAREFVMIFVNSAGEMERKTSPGPDGGNFTWTGESPFNGHPVQELHVFTKRPASAFFRTVELLARNGKWTKVSEETCRR